MNPVRRSTVFVAVFIAGVLVLGSLLVVHPLLDRQARETALAARRDLVRQLQLTDLCLFTEARYTRHLSQADLHAAFQDHPLAFEHFPSGSLVLPPGRFLE